MNTYIKLPDEVLLNSSNLSVELEEELQERLIAGEVTEAEYLELKRMIDEWLKFTRSVIGIYRNIHSGSGRVRLPHRQKQSPQLSIKGKI